MERVWFVTGASRGLGREITRAALSAGDFVMATARQPERLSDLQARFGARLATAQLDVSVPGAAAGPLAATLTRFGHLDVVVNNAGYGSIAPIEDVTDDDFHSQVATHLYGTLSVTRAAVPIFRRQGSGRFIQIASIGGRTGAPGFGVHQAVKWAVEGLSGALANEVAPLGIKVTVVEPGGLRTDYNGVSRRVGYIRPEYAATAGMNATLLGEYHGREPGDPAKAAQAILQVAGMPEPPLRLLLGTDAVRYAAAVAAAQAESDARWRDLSLSIAADDEDEGAPLETV
ncbi:SDR family NAD(P)-dependent oxidoreductase [Actinoplanes sp. TBRC 11911]|uniref:SDR family NAD(P)-dependent oxidoreductase n=1 Tax=Actinoplanes sp. TBRC 11911 TaxID=2729386 RepID=UPI00145CA9F9|nr:SDR family NAD(P)-dependent oxidoreductase [Actinoplanes sp. TBRC 11911]NMO56444.1 SDR family NAD(P)-dependent oxidoreductase [Actinoplanes sp. TBRC 11911]